MKNIYWIKTTTVLKIIFNRFQGHYRRLVAGLLIILLLSGSSIFVATASLGSQAETEEVLSASAEKNMERKTISPVPIDKASERIVVGTVISNETAGIYARREGIVKDVLVDIGDMVKEGQIIARLLPPGVEGQAAAFIAEKRALLQQAEVSAKNAQSVANASLESSQRELEQKMIAYDNAYKKKNAFVGQAENMATTTITSEVAKLAAAEQELVNSQARLRQITDQTVASIIHARQSVERMLLGNRAKASGTPIFTDEVLTNIGISDNAIRNQVIAEYNQLSQQEGAFLSLSNETKQSKMLELATQADNLLKKAQILLKSTTPSDELTTANIAEFFRDLSEAHNELLISKERLQDTANDIAAADKKLLEAKAEQAKNTTIAAREIDVVKVSQDAELQGLAAEIKTYQEKIKLLQAEQQQMVEREKAGIGVAQAMLQQELAASGNADIRSPFSGVVSKRLIRVGEAVDPGMPAFELVNVPTTLAKKAKREIQFGLPEDLNETLKIGDTVEFFLPTDEKTLAQAIVTRKSPQIDPESRIFTVQAKVDDHLIIPHNTRVRVRIATNEEEKVYRIPSGVIKREEGDNTIWILSDDESAKSLSISVLNEDGEFAEVTGDMSENTKILLKAPPFSDQLAPTTL